MARSLGGLFLAGATVGLISLLLPHAQGANLGALSVNVGMAYGGGVLVLFTFRRAPLWIFHGALLAGTLLITRAVYYSGDAISFYGIWYLWAALFGFSFFKRSHAVAHVAIVGLAYAWILNLRPEPVAAARWITTIASLLIAGVFLDALVRRVQRQREETAAHARSLAMVVAMAQRALQAPTADAVRADLLSTAVQVASADEAVLWVPAPGSDTFVAVASTHDALHPEFLTMKSAPAGAGRAFATGRAEFGYRTQSEDADSSANDDLGRICSLWQPIQRVDTTVGLLAVYWRDQLVCLGKA